MARARLLKPDFFDDEKLAALPFGARLLFQALWCEADREGRLEDRPVKLAAFAFPYDTAIQRKARKDAPDWLDALVKAGCVARYEADGKHLLWIPHFKDHQKIHDREAQSSLPPPPEVAQGMQLHALGVQPPAEGVQCPPEAVAVTEASSDTEARTEAVAEADEPPPPAHPFSVMYSQKHRERTGQILKAITHGRALSLEQKYGAEDCIQVADVKGWDHDPSYYVGALEDIKNGTRQLQTVGVASGRGSRGAPTTDVTAEWERYKAGES